MAPHRRSLVAALLAALCALPAGTRAQSYPTLAAEPDPRDFVRRAGTQLTLLGVPFRFGGVEITWLGLRRDGSTPARRPTKYEVLDAMRTAQAMGAAVIRAPGLADTGTCALCLEQQPGQLDDAALAHLDMVLASARDLGLKLILSLADSGRDCASPAEPGIICAAARLPGAGGAQAFFTDAQQIAAFTTRVRQLLDHRNTVDGIPYRDDPTILAWEDCDGCGGAASDQAVSAWSDALGRAVKDADQRHLYETGAFPGRIGPGAANRVPAALYAVHSADIVGDRPTLTGNTDSARDQLGALTDEVSQSGHAYVLDALGWGAALWKTQADLDTWLSTVARTRLVAGAIFGNLQAHAESGGWMPAQPATGLGLAALYFPGRATGEMDLPTMQERGRALRRFDYLMGSVSQTPTYLLPEPPVLIAASHGRITWRGAAGAATYAIERSADPGQPGSWTVVCDGCVTDEAAAWQDQSPQTGAWYRMTPININGHKAEPSEPMQSN